MALLRLAAPAPAARPRGPNKGTPGIPAANLRQALRLYCSMRGWIRAPEARYCLDGGGGPGVGCGAREPWERGLRPQGFGPDRRLLVGAV
ncbi:MAG: hypothetical protein AB1576_08520 [Bacillota bacterium]